MWASRSIAKIQKTGNVLLRNIELRSYNHCCSGKSISTTYSECVFAAVGKQREMRVRHVVTCGVRLYNIFPHYLINDTIFGKKVIEYKMCVLILCTTFV